MRSLIAFTEKRLIRGMRIWPPTAGRLDADFQSARRRKFSLFFFFLFIFFGKNEPGAVGTPRYGGPPAWLARNAISRKTSKRDEIRIDELLIQLFSNIKRSYILPKKLRKGSERWICNRAKKEMWIRSFKVRVPFHSKIRLQLYALCRGRHPNVVVRRTTWYVENGVRRTSKMYIMWKNAEGQ